VSYQDTFTGSGALDTHVSDSGHSYTDLGFGYTAANCTLSGGGMQIAAGDQGGVEIAELVPDECTLVCEATIGAHTGSGYTTLHFQLNDFDSIGIEIDTVNIYFAHDGYTADIPLVTGAHTFRLEITPDNERWYFDDVEVSNRGSRSTPNPGAAFGFYLDRVATSSFVIDSLSLDAVEVEEPTEFWTGFVETTETIEA
jgi:hypothetical protein